MIAYSDSANEFTRELIVYALSPQKEKFNLSIEFLKTTHLDLTESQTSNAPKKEGHLCAFFRQANIGASRKQLFPLLQLLYKSKKFD